VAQSVDESTLLPGQAAMVASCHFAVAADWASLRVTSASLGVRVQPMVARSQSLLETAHPLPSTVALDPNPSLLVELCPYLEAVPRKDPLDLCP
jgi:hypothetical protein